MKNLKTILRFLMPAAFVAASFAQAAPQAQSQVGDPTAIQGKTDRLNRAPVSNEVLKITLPKAQEFKLPNGLTVMVLERHKLPTVNFSLWIKSGALSDPKEMPGLASFTADMLREGTSTRNSQQIANELEDMGATFRANADFGRDLTTVDASCLTDGADKTAALMADMVLNPTFPSDELERYRRRELLGLTQIRTNPGFLARERFLNAIYGPGPLSTQAPTPEALRSVTPASMKEFRDKHYGPNNAILGIAGDITLAQAKALAQKYFGSWKQIEHSASPTPEAAARNDAKVYMVDRPGSVQSNILAGNIAVKRNDPDYIPVSVLNRVLGGSSTARLFQNLREDKGYTYGAYSRLAADIYPGTLVANTEVRNAVTDGSLHELMYEMKRIRDEKVPQSELEEAKRSIVSSFALSLESPSNLLDRSMTVKYYGLPADYWDTYATKVAAVTADIVQQMAQKYVDLQHLQVVVVGDAKQVGDAVAKYGTVEQYDADGKPTASTKPSNAGTGSPK